MANNQSTKRANYFFGTFLFEDGKPVVCNVMSEIDRTEGERLELDSNSNYSHLVDGEFVVGRRYNAAGIPCLLDGPKRAIMFRNWKEFNEAQRYETVKDFLLKADELVLTPNFRVKCREIIIRDQKYLYCGFRIDKESGIYVSEKMVCKSREQHDDDSLRDIVYFYGNSRDFKYGDEIFTLGSPMWGRKRGYKLKWDDTNAFLTDTSFWKVVALGKSMRVRINGFLGEKLSDGRWHSRQEVINWLKTLAMRKEVLSGHLGDSLGARQREAKVLAIKKAVESLMEKYDVDDVFYDELKRYNTVEIRGDKNEEWSVRNNEAKDTQNDEEGVDAISSIEPRGVHVAPQNDVGADDASCAAGGKNALGGDSENCDELEMEFLSGFRDYVKHCGFDFEIRDLVRFHTCVKCGWLTLLGGDPGCGKSSLAELYARALLGKRYKGDRPHAHEDRSLFLRVNVNPSWVEPADVFGFSVGTDSKDFHPALCGLREFLADKTSDVMRVACLEEINLARVERYFADVIQAISSNENESVSLPDPMPSGKEGVPKVLDVGAGVRLIGTFNEDETVQPMSSRFLDRCAVIRLMVPPAADEYFSKPRGLIKPFGGEAVKPDEYKKWCSAKDDNNGGVKVEIDKLLSRRDDVIKVTILGGLKEIGALPSPRVCGAIEKYVVLRPNFEGYTDEQHLKLVLDEALAQRVFSKCRALPQSEAYGQLIEAVKSALKVEVEGEIVPSVSCEVLERLKKESEYMMQWGA